MRRREFIAGIGAATALPLSIARAQQADRVRLVGLLNILAENDPESRLRG